MRRILILLCLASLPLAGMAQDPKTGPAPGGPVPGGPAKGQEQKTAPASAEVVEVKIPQGADWQVFTRPSDKPSDLRLIEGAKDQVLVPLDKARALVVVDKKANRAAEKPMADSKSLDVWTPDAKDFTRIAEAKVVVSHEGRPVASAMVSLSAGRDSRETLLTPSDKGAVLFKNLPAGALTATVGYKIDKDDRKTAPVSLTPGPEGAVSLAVEIPDKVEVLEEKAAPSASSTPAASPAAAPAAAAPRPSGPGQSPVAVIVNFLIGVAILGAIGYGLYMYFKKDPKQVAELLKKAGLDPDAAKNDAPPAAAAPAPKPLQKIVLDDAAPAPAAGPVVMAASPAAAPGLGQPRLTLEDGSTFAIPEGEVQVGRDPGASLVIGGEKGVSRLHAVVKRSGAQVSVSDLGSTNGTYVNGRKVSDETALKTGDIVIFGAARCRYEG